MPETEFENAPIADEEDVAQYAKLNLERCTCENKPVIYHDENCPKFEDNSHASENPL